MLSARFPTPWNNVDASQQMLVALFSAAVRKQWRTPDRTCVSVEFE
jgi:hypothetical protein